MNALLFNLLLALAWVAVMGSFTLGTLVSGLLIGYVVILFTETRLGRVGYGRRVWRVASFAGYFLWELLLSNLRVARDVLSPRPQIRPGVISLPLDVDTDAEITLLANLITMTPGTLSLEVSDDRKVLYIHAMYLDDIEALRKATKEGFEKRVMEVFR